MIEKANHLVIVTPVFEDAESSKRLFVDLTTHYGEKVYVAAVDDGSVNEPINASSLETAGLNGVVITLRRNVGHQRAILYFKAER